MYEFATLFLTRTEYLVPWRLEYYPPTMVVDVICQGGKEFIGLFTREHGCYHPA